MMILVIFLESFKIKRLLGVTMDTVVMHHFQIYSNIKTYAPYHPLQESAFKFHLHTLHYQNHFPGLFFHSASLLYSIIHLINIGQQLLNYFLVYENLQFIFQAFKLSSRDWGIFKVMHL